MKKILVESNSLRMRPDVLVEAITSAKSDLLEIMTEIAESDLSSRLTLENGIIAAKADATPTHPTLLGNIISISVVLSICQEFFESAEIVKSDAE